MGQNIELQDQQLIENDELVADLCRFRELLVSEKFIRRKHKLDNATWERLGGAEGDALIAKIEEESLRRVRSGQLKRERAQAAVTHVPLVLSSIVDDPGQNSRHRIDAGLALDKMAANSGPEGAPASDRFIIQINLGADVLKFDRSIEINPHDIDPNDVHASDTPNVIAAIAAKKDDDSDEFI